MNVPALLHLGTRVPGGTGADPLQEMWSLAWIGHALLHAPLDLFQANAFWPQPDSLARSTAPLGFAPVAVLAGSAHVVLGYGLLFLFASALAWAGVFLLERELGLSSVAAAVAGLAFAYAPWRIAHQPHLNILSSGAIPLALFLLLRGYRRASPGYVLAGWLVVAWQISIGLVLGLQFLYLPLVVGL